MTMLYDNIGLPVLRVFNDDGPNRGWKYCYIRKLSDGFYYMTDDREAAWKSRDINEVNAAMQIIKERYASSSTIIVLFLYNIVGDDEMTEILDTLKCI